MRLRSRRRSALMRFQRCANQGVWVSRHEGKRTAKLSVNVSTAVLPALNPGALGRQFDVQSRGDACLVRRRRRDRVRTNFCDPLFRSVAELHSITFSLWAVAAYALPGGVCADLSVGAV